jgi:hypothetical protein
MATPYRGNGLQRSVPAPFTAVRIDTWVLRLLEADLDEQAEVEVAPGQAGGSCVVLRSDGGLWVAVGNDRVWNIFNVPARAWRPASNVSGVVPMVTAGPVRKVG